MNKLLNTLTAAALIALNAQATTPTKRLTLDIGRPENTFVLGPISRGSTEYIDAALYVRGVAYPTNDLSGYLWYSVANTSTAGVSIANVQADTINGHVYFQMSTAQTLGLSTNSGDYPITYYASVVLTNATQTFAWDVGSLIIRWDAATAGAGVSDTYPIALNETDPLSVRTTGTRAMTGDLNMGGFSITNIAASSLGFVGGVSFGAADVTRFKAATNNTGDITGVTAGTWLSGGGASGSVTLNSDTNAIMAAVVGKGYITSYSETDPIWAAVSNTVSSGAALGTTSVQVGGATNVALGGAAAWNSATRTFTLNTNAFPSGSGSGDLTAVQVSGGLLTVSSGTGPIPIVGLTTGAVQAAQSPETDPVWGAASNAYPRTIVINSTTNTVVGGTVDLGTITASEVQSLSDVMAIGNDALNGNITNVAIISSGASASGYALRLGTADFAHNGFSIFGFYNDFVAGNFFGATNIPKSGLRSTVQASLGLADSAMQPGDAVESLAGVAHRLLYVDALGDVSDLAYGTSGKVLTAAGTTSVPTWETPAAGGGLIPAFTNSSSLTWPVTDNAPADADVITVQVSGSVTSLVFSAPAPGGGGNPIDSRAATNTVDMGGYPITQIDYTTTQTNASHIAGVAAHLVQYVKAGRLYYVFNSVTNFLELD